MGEYKDLQIRVSEVCLQKLYGKLNTPPLYKIFLNGVNGETKWHSKQQRLSARHHAREHQFE